MLAENFAREAAASYGSSVRTLVWGAAMLLCKIKSESLIENLYVIK